MKFLHYFLLLSIFSANLFAQNLFIKGTLVDSLNKQPMTGANVLLYHLPDSTLKGRTTNINGQFTFNNLNPAKYLLKISYVGYKTFKQNLVLGNHSIDFTTIYLSPGEVETKEVEVIGKIPPVIQNEDTTEINANAFKTNSNANAEDLLTKMPGIMVQDGKVQAQGEDVKKVLVDGKPFFGDDPNAVIKNIPAEIIEKIQVFDQQSEQSQFTGFDDGNTSKTINIVTRLKVREGTFGKLGGGYGNESKYQAGGNINFFNDDRRISVLSQFNNINEQNFSSEDLLGVMASTSFGGGRRGRNFSRAGRGGGGNSRGGGSFGGGDASNFLVNSKNGLTNTQSFGLNFSDKLGEKLDLTGSYFFNQTKNNAESKTFRDYFLQSNSSDTYNEINSTTSKNINHRLNFRINYQIDSANSLLFRPKITVQQNDGNSSILGNTNSSEQILNSITNSFNSNLSALNAANDLLFRHRFETRGRTFSLNINTSYARNRGENKLLSENLYYDNTTLSDTLDQNADLLSNGFNTSSNIVFTEPIDENSFLQFNTRFLYSEDKSDQNTFDNTINNSGIYSVQDTSLSNVYQKIYKTESFGAGYRYQKNQMFLMANISYSISQLLNNQTFPHSTTVEKNFSSILPSFMLRMNFSRDENLRFFYRTNNNEPSVTQLQNVPDNSNPVQLSIGNPELKQDYRHSLTLRYSSMSSQTLNSFFVLLGGTFTNNYIGNETIIAKKDTLLSNGIELKRGSQLKTPVNLDGYMNFRSFLAYSIPVYLLKSNLSLNANATYARTPAIVNNLKSFSNSTRLGLGFVLSSNISEKLDITLSSNSSYNIVKSNLSNGDNNYFNQSSRFKFFWEFWNGFIIQSDLNQQYNGGLASDYNKNYYLWNLGLGKKLFSKDQGEIRFTVNDVLNQNTNIQRTVTDAYYEDVQSNVLGRYFLISFIYNIKAF